MARAEVRVRSAECGKEQEAFGASGEGEDGLVEASLSAYEPDGFRSDEELLQAWRESHSESAFSELVDRHQGQVYSTCKRILMDTHSAEDVTQAVFLVLTQKGQDLPKGASVAGWLYGVARICALKYRRGEGRRARRERAAAQASVGTESRHDRAETGNAIRAHVDTALAALPEPQREALTLRFLCGRSETEAAAALRCPVRTLHSRVSTGLAALRQEFRRKHIHVAPALLVNLLDRQAAEALPADLASRVKATCLGKSAASSVVRAMAVETGKALAPAPVVPWLWAGGAFVAAAASLVVAAQIYLREPPEERPVDGPQAGGTRTDETPAPGPAARPFSAASTPPELQAPAGKPMDWGQDLARADVWKLKSPFPKDCHTLLPGLFSMKIPDLKAALSAEVRPGDPAGPALQCVRPWDLALSGVAFRSHIQYDSRHPSFTLCMQAWLMDGPKPLLPPTQRTPAEGTTSHHLHAEVTFGEPVAEAPGPAAPARQVATKFFSWTVQDGRPLITEKRETPCQVWAAGPAELVLELRLAATRVECLADGKVFFRQRLETPAGHAFFNLLGYSVARQGSHAFSFEKVSIGPWEPSTLPPEPPVQDEGF